MYNLFYWAYGKTLMCTVSDYEVCKEAVEILIDKHPDSKIWMEKVETIDSLQEWKDKFNSKIKAYD